MGEIISWALEKIRGFFLWIFERLEGLLDWCVDQFQGVFWFVVDGLYDVALLFLYLIPVPSWMHADNLLALINNIPPSIWWGLEALQVGTGLSMILTAYVVRFFIRRLPVFG